MIYCIDIDGTICDTEGGDYEKSVPRREVIDTINRLYAKGHYILIFTARGATSGRKLRNFTLKQLKSWGLKFNKLKMGKPDADIFLDDKAVNFNEWRGAL